MNADHQIADENVYRGCGGRYSRFEHFKVKGNKVYYWCECGYCPNFDTEEKAIYRFSVESFKRVISECNLRLVRPKPVKTYVRGM